MKIEEFAEGLYKEMDFEKGTEDLNLEKVKILCSTLIQPVKKLNDFAAEYDFENKEEEIIFFKYVKPKVISRFMYYQKMLSIFCNIPLAMSNGIQQYYVTELQKIQGYIDNNKDFYNYYKSGSTVFDEVYFTRKDPDPWLSFNTDVCEDSLCTLYDHKVSRLMAYEDVSLFLIEKIKALDNTGNAPGQGLSVTWTASKAALVELLYALQTSGSCNNGSLDVKDLARHLEQLFNVKLGNFYRTFQEIRIRKISRTTFLDQLKESLIKRMDDSDENPRY